MEIKFQLELTGCRLSADYLNPGETLFVTLQMRNRGGIRAPENYRFVLDIVFGHQRKIENKQYRHRVVSEPFPGTSKLEPGMEAETALRWEAAVQWSGTYRMTFRMLDKHDTPISFYTEETGNTTALEIGEANISWNFGRPWVAENKCPVIKRFKTGYVSEKSFCADNYKGETIGLSDIIPVVLAKREPRILSFANIPFSYASPEIILKHLPTGSIVNAAASPRCAQQFSLHSHSNTRAEYMGLLRYEGVFAAAFLLTIELSGRVLTVSVTERNEANECELLSVDYPSLAETDKGYLLDFYGGGRLIAIADAEPISFEKTYDVRNAAVLYNESEMLIVESAHIDSKLTTGVFSANGQKRGFVGGGIVCRIPAEGSRRGIPVSVPPVFAVESAEPNGRAFDWTDAAALLRRGVKPNYARDMYRSAYLYKQLSTWGPKPDDRFLKDDRYPTTQNLFRSVTFREIADNVKGFSRLTDNAKQIIYVTGFQKGGFDNAYPFPYDTDIRCGSLTDLAESLLEMREYNAVSGLHDNFDDVSFPNLNIFPFVAEDRRGEPWIGWVWPAGPTYMTALKRYAESGAMAERVRKMCEMLPLKDSYHIDVLTAETCRYDFNPEHPASAEDSYRAKIEIIREWNKHGIDITSEMLSHPSVGHIGFALHTRFDTREVFIPGDTFVPLTHMVYHGVIGYTAPSSTKEEILWGLLVGAQVFYEADITGEHCISRYYIQNIPAMKLYDKTMTGFVRENGKARSDYGEGSYVEADFSEETYRVVADGILIGQNFSVFVPANSKNAYLAYSFDNREHVYGKPSCFSDAGAVSAVALTKDGEGEPAENAVRLDGDKVILRLPPMTPVKIIAGE